MRSLPPALLLHKSRGSRLWLRLRPLRVPHAELLPGRSLLRRLLLRIPMLLLWL